MGSTASKQQEGQGSSSSASEGMTPSAPSTSNENGGQTITRVEPPPKYQPPEGIETKTFEPLEVEVDDEGFVKSFALDDREGYLKFFEEYGFVVVNGVLSEEEVEASVNEIWQEVEALSRDEEPIFRTSNDKKETEGEGMSSMAPKSASAKNKKKDSGGKKAEERGVSRDDPSTWDRDWPGGRLGIMGNDIAAGPMVCFFFHLFY